MKTTVKLQTPLDVFKYIVENKSITYRLFFICSTIDYLNEDKIISKDLCTSTLNVLRAFRPSITADKTLSEYTQSPYWYGGYAWWLWKEHDEEHNGRVIQIKYNYLRDLIAHLENK